MPARVSWAFSSPRPIDGEKAGPKGMHTSSTSARGGAAAAGRVRRRGTGGLREPGWRPPRFPKEQPWMEPGRALLALDGDGLLLLRSLLLLRGLLLGALLCGHHSLHS